MLIGFLYELHKNSILKKITKGTYYQLRHFLISIMRHQNTQRQE